MALTRPYDTSSCLAHSAHHTTSSKKDHIPSFAPSLRATGIEFQAPKDSMVANSIEDFDLDAFDPGLVRACLCANQKS